MKPGEVEKRFRLLASVVSVLLLAAIAAAGWFYRDLRKSLPQLDGTRTLPGLAAPVTVTRDARGVPSIRGRSRADVTRALGFLHAQDRFFQMDLLRRRAAGELAALFGKDALPLDRHTRPHHFRALAQQVVATLPATDRALLDAYAAGVNAGISALGCKPFEYVVTRTSPAPWLPEDSVLVAYAMTLELQDDTDRYEHSLETLRNQLGNAGLAFYAPLLTPGDAALDGSSAPLPPVPGPDILDLRSPAAAPGVSAANPVRTVTPDTRAEEPEMLPGSNSFAVTGAHTANHSALLANDPHLHLAVPNIWYRVLLEWPEGTAGAVPRRVVGVTIPGLPLVVLGSNGHVAWGLTDAYADTSDLVAVEVSPGLPDFYQLPGSDQFREIETRRDTIEVKGGRPESVETRWTYWGPVVGTDWRGRPLADHWVAYDPAATNLNFRHLETAQNVTEAVRIAHDSGIPAHNFLVADSAGAIAWTIAGRFPRRVGFDGRLPVTWSYGDRRWDGYVTGADIPTIFLRPGAPAVSPAPLLPVVQEGRLWTANNRLLGGEALARIGDGGYASPPRAAQIRDRLAKLATASPQDFLAIQLDDRAVFLERWQRLALAVLTPDAIGGKPSRREFRDLVARWEGCACTDSVSYRLVREFRHRAADLVLGAIFAGCAAVNPDFDWHRFDYEPALWTLLEQRPAHLLPPRFASRDELLLAAVDAVVSDLHDRGITLPRATWGDANRASIVHPIGRALPGVLGRWLNLPPDPLPGDANMPRIQAPSFGASMRLVVSPGHENEGVFEMPGGQSGHPLSPFYRAGHEDWVHGKPVPLLPGATTHTLTLRP